MTLKCLYKLSVACDTEIIFLLLARKKMDSSCLKSRKRVVFWLLPQKDKKNEELNTGNKNRYSNASLERISRDQVILCLRVKMPYSQYRKYYRK